MKLSRIAVPASAVRHLAESVSNAGYPRGERSLSYHLIRSALDLQVLREGFFDNLAARAKAGLQSPPDLDNLLWITGPTLETTTADYQDVLRRTNHLDGSLLDPGNEEWWHAAFSLFSSPETERAKVLQQARTWYGATQDIPPGDRPDEGSSEADLSVGEVSKAPHLDDMKKELAAVIRRHKGTGDQIEQMLKDLKADLAAKRAGPAREKAEEIIATDSGQGAAPPKKGKPRQGTGVVSKRSSVPKPFDVWGAEAPPSEGALNYFLANMLVEEIMLQRGEEVLQHALATMYESGTSITISPLGKILYEDWLHRMNLFAETSMGSRLKRGLGSLWNKGKEAWRQNAVQSAQLHNNLSGIMGGVRDHLAGLGDNPNDKEYNKIRTQNIVMARSILVDLSRMALNKLMRLPLNKGEELMNAERTRKNRATARRAIGLDGKPGPKPKESDIGQVSPTPEFGP